jgi:hypothetical protein
MKRLLGVEAIIPESKSHRAVFLRPPEPSDYSCAASPAYAAAFEWLMRNSNQAELPASQPVLKAA